MLSETGTLLTVNAQQSYSSLLSFHTCILVRPSSPIDVVFSI